MKTTTTGRNNGIQWTLWTQLDDLDFADERSSHTATARIQDKTNRLETVSAGTGLKINRKKTELMKINSTANTPVTVQGSPSGQGRIQDFEMGVNFCNNAREIKYYFNIWGIRKRKRKMGAQKKEGENSPISPPLDPRLQGGGFLLLPWKYHWPTGGHGQRCHSQDRQSKSGLCHLQKDLQLQREVGFAVWKRNLEEDKDNAAEDLDMNQHMSEAHL